MSYILDALRKSEQERQISAGQSVGLLYPIEHKRKRNLWPPILLVFAVMATSALTWWIGMPPTLTKAPNTNNKPAISVIPQLQTIPQETFSEPKVIPEKILREHNSMATPEKLIPEYARRKIPVSHHDASQKLPTQTDLSAGTPAVINNAVSVDPLKNLPALEISGYIHNESGNLAIINNQLVHEGEEVSPGLILVKILENSVIFSYRGYVFSR